MPALEFLKTVLCYGDSLSWGIVPGTRNRHPFNRRWTGILQASLWPGVRIVEECLNGRTTVWDDPFRLLRNGKTSMLPTLEAHSPLDLVILFLGANDLLRIYGMDAFHAAQGAGTLIDIVQASRVEGHYPPPKVLLLSPPRLKPSNSMVKKFSDAAAHASHEFTAWYGRIAEEKGCLFFDTATSIATSAVDGVHLDEAAHRALANDLKPVVKAALGM
jgi:lysophospholipase L1-like esterase